MKVGDHMDKINIVKKVIQQSGGIAKTAQFVDQGLTTYDVARLCREGYIERIRHGFYQLPESDDITEETLLSTLLPEGIVCMESALFYYRYSDFTPRVWTIAVPRTFSRTKLQGNSLPIKVYYIPKEQYTLGRTTADIGEAVLSIYDRERTICDCFKYRTKLDSELFNKAMHAYVDDEKKNLRNLSEYAREMGIYKKVTDIMEVMLNG